MIARISRSGRGDVWHADDLLLKTPVALKLIRSANASTRARINQEVRLSRRITHQAVCRVFDIGEEGGTMFFSMELVHGGNLAELVKRTGRLAEEKVLHIAHQLCSALAAVHSQGVLHGDLAPSNVLIDQDGQVRMIDFGKSVASGDQLCACTDIYAVGAILYELVTGQRPDSAARKNGQPVPPSRLAPDISPRLERAILKTLSMNQKDRPPTALALAAELPPFDDARGNQPALRRFSALLTVIGQPFSRSALTTTKAALATCIRQIERLGMGAAQ